MIENDAPATSLSVLVLRDLEAGDLVGHVDRAIADLARGNFRAADVKKMRGTGLYRARLDDSNRLLFKFGEHGGRKVVLVLEVVRNHAYDKARFLNGGSYTEADFDAVSDASAVTISESLRYVHPSSPALHMLDKPLSFDDAQSAVFATPLPLILVGSAGSGKTALTLEKLKVVAGQGLYLTRSSFLVESSRNLYFAGRYENAGQEVDFLSLRELVETIEVPKGRESTWADFSKWYERMQSSFRVRDAHKIYEEIKGVITGAAEDGPYLDEPSYLALGVRQSIFLGDERRTVFQVFRRWLEHLRDNDLFDANMAAWAGLAKAQPRYDFVFIDEVQDITNVELRLALATLRDKRNFLLCGDSNQIVHPNLFSWARVKSLFYGAVEGDDLQGSPLEQIHVLAANYRNTQAVTALGNRLLRIKQRRFGSIDRESNYLVTCASDEPGQVDLRGDTPALRREVNDKTQRSANYAVIVLRDEDKPAAREAFATPLLFSVHEAKGLEYDHVILFRLVSGAPAEYRACADGVSPSDLEGDLGYARARDKTDKSLDAYKFYVNALYVALTRARKTLLVVEAETEHPLFRLLTVEAKTNALVLEKEESSHEDWQREARRLELQGKAEQAEQIRREVLGTQGVPWPVAAPAAIPALRQQAIGEGPHDKAAQQLLFEFALTYDAKTLTEGLAQAGFRHARKPWAGQDFIERTYHQPYRERRSSTLVAQLRKYGVNFRNPLNQTPLMVAALVGRGDWVTELLEMGADPELHDSGGRNALQLALLTWLETTAYKDRALVEVVGRLSTEPVKVKVGAQMRKLDPRSMEWFLFHVLAPRFRQYLAHQQKAEDFTARRLGHLLTRVPDALLAPHRKQGPYLSALLSKNEAHGNSPYNRRLFLRIRRGVYIPNPAVEIARGERWVPLFEYLELPLLFEQMHPLGAEAWEQLRALEARTRAALASGAASEIAETDGDLEA